MTVRFFHTSDWHLGQFFYNHSRHYEHEQFLAWLLEQIKHKQPHALLIAGDIFDVINPSSQAQKQLYQFLADAHELAPHMQTLMIAGNHDSGYRIEQVEPLLAKYNAKTVGVIRWNEDKTLDLERLILPIYDEQKQIVAWCIALPFLRSAEITGFNEHTTNSQNAIAYLHQQLIEEAKRRKTDDQALILMSHAHMQGGETSDSERPIMKKHFLPACLMTVSIMWRLDICINRKRYSIPIFVIVALQFHCHLVKSTISTKWSKSPLIRPNQKISWILKHWQFREVFNCIKLKMNSQRSCSSLKTYRVAPSKISSIVNMSISNIIPRFPHSRIYANNSKMPCRRIATVWCVFPDNIYRMKIMLKISRALAWSHPHQKNYSSKSGRKRAITLMMKSLKIS